MAWSCPYNRSLSGIELFVKVFVKKNLIAALRNSLCFFLWIALAKISDLKKFKKLV